MKNLVDFNTEFHDLLANEMVKVQGVAEKNNIPPQDFFIYLLYTVTHNVMNPAQGAVEKKITRKEVETNIGEMLKDGFKEEAQYWQEKLDDWPQDAKYLVVKTIDEDFQKTKIDYLAQLMHIALEANDQCPQCFSEKLADVHESIELKRDKESSTEH